MKHEVAFWGCIICSQLWVAAPGSEPIDIIMGFLWLVFALLIWIFRNAKWLDPSQSGDEQP